MLHSSRRRGFRSGKGRVFGRRTSLCRTPYTRRSPSESRCTERASGCPATPNECQIRGLSTRSTATDSQVVGWRTCGVPSKVVSSAVESMLNISWTSCCAKASLEVQPNAFVCTTPPTSQVRSRPNRGAKRGQRRRGGGQRRGWGEAHEHLCRDGAVLGGVERGEEPLQLVRNALLLLRIRRRVPLPSVRSAVQSAGEVCAALSRGSSRGVRGALPEGGA